MAKLYWMAILDGKVILDGYIGWQSYIGWLYWMAECLAQSQRSLYHGLGCDTNISMHNIANNGCWVVQYAVLLDSEMLYWTRSSNITFFIQ